MQHRFISVSILSLFIFIFAISSVQAKVLNLCKHIGVLNAMYLNETPQRLVIYDAEFSIEKLVSIYKVDNKPQRGNYKRAGIKDLYVGATLSYKVDNIRDKRISQIREIWLLPDKHCRSSE